MPDLHRTLLITLSTFLVACASGSIHDVPFSPGRRDPRLRIVRWDGHSVGHVISV
jgi:hypothetical protein